MCGIVGYVGKKEAVPILMDGLRRLEYRGYDSAGICGFINQGIYATKSSGRIENLQKKIKNVKALDEIQCGIGHTRWATHGKPNKTNSHPHHDCGKKIWLVHNGIIENYRELKNELIKEGHKFTSETDTEVLAHMIEREIKKAGIKTLEEALRIILKQVRGTYGLAVISADEPNKIVVARKGSPLLVGVGNNEYIVASDASAVAPYTKKIVHLNDSEMAVLTPDSFSVFTLDAKPVVKKETGIGAGVLDVEMGDFDSFMMKEIFEQPEVIQNTLRGRLVAQDGAAKLGGFEDLAHKLRRIKKIIISGCGSAYYAGCVGEYMLEEYAGLTVEVDYASEFRYRKPVVDKDTAFLAISQSGETADTLSALREAKRKGAFLLGIVNTVGSTIASEIDAGIYTHAGTEIGVAATKTFTSQLIALSVFTLMLGRQRNMSVATGRDIVKELHTLPEKIQKILDNTANIQRIAKKYAKYDNFLYMGRKYNYPVAMEGALKLKEISYIHAEGCGAGEMKHGTIALIDKNFPTLAICPKDSVYEKMVSNIEEIKARKGPVIGLTTQGNKSLENICDDVIYIPRTLEMLTPVLAIIPLQLLAYYIGISKGNDVDKPRNLAKSVTVE